MSTRFKDQGDDTVHALKRGTRREEYNKTNLAMERETRMPQGNISLPEEVVQWQRAVVESLEAMVADGNGERAVAAYALLLDQIAESSVGEILREYQDGTNGVVYDARSREENLSPQEVESAFERLEAELGDYEGKRGRKSIRAKRIYGVLQGRENELIALSEYAEPFQEKTKKPRDRAAAAINVLNAQWHELGEKLEFEGEVYYRLRRRS